MNQLDALKKFTTVVADTGDFHQLAAYAPQDATTNPSLILKAVQKPEYAPLLADAVAKHGAQGKDEVMNRLLVAFRLRDPETHSWPRLHRSGRPPELRHRSHRGPRPPHHRALRGRRRGQRPRADQDGLDLGRHSGRGPAGARRHPLQPHPVVLLCAGRGLRPGQGAADLALCGPHLRLVQEDRWRSRGTRPPWPKPTTRVCSRCARSTTSTRSTASPPR